MSDQNTVSWEETKRKMAERLEWRKAHPVEATKELLRNPDVFDYEEHEIITALVAHVERLQSEVWRRDGYIGALEERCQKIHELAAFGLPRAAEQRS